VKPTKEATSSIIKGLALLCYERKELSGSLKYFVRALVRNGVPQTRDFRFLHEIHMEIALKKKVKDITTLEEFQSMAPGYLRLTVSAWRQQDHGHFEAITWEMARCSILKGCYVTPFAYSLFRDHANLVSGLPMDTTWRIIQLHVALILTIGIGNVGIPVALSSGPIKDTALSNTFYLRFRSLFNLDLSTYILESDQGSAFHAICSKYHNRHLACLRHLLVSLGRKPFA
jgi:hypothetical protein